MSVLDDLFFQRSRFRLPLHILVFLLVAAVTSSIPYIFESARSHWRLLILPEDTFPTSLNPAPPVHCEPEYHGVLKNTSLSYLRPLVARTKGFYVRDWPVHLGWNNVSPFPLPNSLSPIVVTKGDIKIRYNLEAWLLHAKLLNRTLVVPSHLLTRSCDATSLSFSHVCAAYFAMVNRGDEVHSDEWRILPMNKQMGWRVPIEIMFDFPLLRAAHPVITVNDYLRLQGLDPVIERHDADWDRDAYQYSVSKTAESRNVSLHRVPNAEYEPFGTTRVDRLKGPGIDIPQPAPESDIVSHILQERMGDGHALFQEDAEHALLENNVARTWSDWATFYLFLREHGWIGLETFKTTEWLRTVTRPMQQLAPVSKLRGLVDDFGPIDAEVLLIEGSTHKIAKRWASSLGQLRFTSAAPRDVFSEMVLTHMHPIRPIIELADRLAQRMLGMNHGRMWMASHMRRGDCGYHSLIIVTPVPMCLECVLLTPNPHNAVLRWGWSLEQGLADHLKHLKNGLNDGREASTQLFLSEIKDVSRRIIAIDLETDGDPVWNTGDGSSWRICSPNSTGAASERAGHSWSLTSLVFWSKVSRVGRRFSMVKGSSSVSGGVVNMRGAQGFDPRCTFIDN
ncbi:hypothetical protein BS47DRAFT_1487135 [Hydnum rufescens UP504]|uniref:Uncharacterized protein n=1 Tax=Hydnum rufescens UP504 TaxID=1448309 RepID=A0A9P6AS28_9AGAM|nr:hypothetical protein BS47DRAFT_1487135 [Hydnum rufescens UP504]